MLKEKVMTKNEHLHDLKKVRIEHLYKNMNDLLKEIRFLDKTIIVFSGAIWAWIIQYNVTDYNVVVYFFPFIISCLLGLKTYGLLMEFEKECEKYKSYNISKKSISTKNKSMMNVINLFYYGCIITANLVLAIYLKDSPNPQINSKIFDQNSTFNVYIQKR